MSERVRYEYKYRITTGAFLQLENRLQGTLKPDKHGVGGSYCVRSLYFDSVSDSDYHANISGQECKGKVRLRVYPPHFEKVTLEWKCKTNEQGKKHSLILTKEMAEAMIKGDFTCLQKREDTLSRTLYTRMMRGCYRPKGVVQYERIAYTHGVSDVRITFDKNIRGMLTPEEFFLVHPNFLPLMHVGEGILEVKWTGFLPYPIKRLLGGVDTVQIANSKYVQMRNLMLS